jgi:cytochrome bd-type quinol oxidase subunit 1
MAIPAHPSLVVSLGIAALVAWRLYSRFRRMFGRQTMSPRRTWIRLTFFSILIAALLLVSAVHPMHAVALLGGVVAGAALGWYGIRLTRFEQTPEGLFYTPSLHLGIALSALFLGRLIYRGVLLYSATTSTSSAFPSAEFSGSPLTLLIFGILAGYYVTYAIGLLLWRRRVGSLVPPPIGAGPGAQ